jgi:hypothetical protein
VKSIEHYLCLYAPHKLSFPGQCLHCGKTGLWLHGHYDRKAVRFIRPGERTCYALPECIPPRRWYVWAIQQFAFLLWLSCESFYASANTTAKTMATPSHHTIKRWIGRFQEQFHLHKDALRQILTSLGRALDFTAFWQTSLKTLSLAQAIGCGYPLYECFEHWMVR